MKNLLSLLVVVFVLASFGLAQKQTIVKPKSNHVLKLHVTQKKPLKDRTKYITIKPKKH